MKTITEWFDEYSESHQNQTNKAIHWACVPAILFAIIGILAHFSALLTALLIVLTLVFYTRLDIVLAVAMTALIAVMAWLIYLLPVGVGFYIGVFVLAWIGQFYGHKVDYQNGKLARNWLFSVNKRGLNFKKRFTPYFFSLRNKIEHKSTINSALNSVEFSLK